jgi:hypothetical protein
LVKYKTLQDIENTEGKQYADLCADELRYLNSKGVHDKIQDKMLACVYGKESSCMNLRVNYQLAIKNVVKYNELKQREQTASEKRV